MSTLAKTFYLALTFAASATASAQYNPMPDSIVKVDSKGVVVTRSYFKYDSDDRQTDVEHWNLNRKEMVWSGTYKEHVEYDSFGNQTSKIVSYWNFDTHDWIVSQKEINTFDKAGRPIGEESTSYDKDSKTWTGEYKFENIFNEKGQRVKTINYAWDFLKENWSEEMVTTCEYDDKNHKTQDIVMTREDNTMRNETKREYTYDDMTNRLLQTTYYDWDGTAWHPKKRVKNLSMNASESDGERLTVTMTQTYDDATKEWSNSERTSVRSDGKGSEVLNKRETWKGKEWQTSQMERTDIKYNEAGDRTNVNKFRWDGGDNWTIISKDDIDYNEYGDCIAEVKSEYSETNDEWIGVVNFKMEYNNMGDLVMEQRYKWEEKWENASRANYDYDGDHNKVGETTSSWNPQKRRWEEFYRARVELKFDKEGYITNEKEFHWEDKSWKHIQTTQYF